MKKKTILATILLATLTTATVSINAQEIEVLNESENSNQVEAISMAYDEPIGVNKAKISPDGAVLSIMATGQAELLIGDQQDIRIATKKAEMRAKAAITKFLSETISSSDTQDELIDTITSNNGTESSIAREVVEKMTETVSGNAQAVLKGVVTLKQDVNRDEKFVTITLGFNENTVRAATAIKQSIEQPTSAPHKNNANTQQNIKTQGRDVRVSKMMEDF